MNYFLITTILVFLSAAFGFINVRFLKLPNTIGLMVITIFFTLGVFVLGYFDDTLLNAEKYIITQIDFKTLLLDIMLSFLLFAGAPAHQLSTIACSTLAYFGVFNIRCIGFNVFGRHFFLLLIDGIRYGCRLCVLPSFWGIDFTY